MWTDDPEDDHGDVLAELLRSVATMSRAMRVRDARLEPTTRAVVQAASAFTGFDASLVLIEHGQIVQHVANDGRQAELVQIEQRTGLGPNLEAALTSGLVCVDDLANDRRWGGFGKAAASVGVASVISVPIAEDARVLGALSLYSDRAGALSALLHPHALICATLAAAAVVDAQRSEQLHGALERRDIIGQAKGILMAYHKVDATQAFDLMRTTSQMLNHKLFVVAQYVVETGALPLTP